MSNAPTVEERIANLEKELAEVKQRIGMGQGPVNWLPSIVGSMAKYPEFKEVVRLGREIRQSDRPDAE
jgi:hypothetical protein